MRSIPKEVVDALRAVPLFSACSEADLRSIVGLGTEAAVRDGKVITEQGKPGREFCLIIDGAARCLVDSQQVATLGPGDFFGQMSLLDLGLHRATIISEGVTHLLVVDSAEFSRLVGSSPSIAKNLLLAAAARVTRSTLATDEEIRAEHLAARIAADPAVGAAEAVIVDLWRDRLSAKIGALNPQDEALLGPAVRELAFACAQLAANADPARPAVTWVESPPHTWFANDVPGGRYAADNPDTIYRQVPIDGVSTYRIDGRIVGHRPVSSVYQAVANPLLPAPVPGGQLDGAALVVRPDGRFTITVGPEPLDGEPNHLLTNATAAQVFLRDTLADWAAQTAPALSVRRLSGPPPAPAPAFDQLVHKAVNDLGVAGRQWIDSYIVGVLFGAPVNVVPAPVHSAGIYRSSGHFELAPDQALVVTVNPADAAYMSMVLYNVWSVTPSYWSRQTSLTNAQAVPNPDGTYTFVASAADPGVRNWLDTTGLEQGTFLVRWQDVPAASATGPASPSVTGRLVDTSDLPRVLPSATEPITKDDRAEQLRRRGRDFERRIASGATVNGLW